MSLTQKIVLGLGAFLASIVIFLLGVFGVTSYWTSGLKKPIQAQLAAIRVEDYVLAYTFTSPNFQSATPLEAFKQFIINNSGLRNNETIKFNSREIQDNTGLVEAVLISRGGDETPVRYKLIKLKGKWKIEAIALRPSEASSHASQESSSALKGSESAAHDAPQQLTLANDYQNNRYHFSMRYPEGWSYSEPSPSSVIFKGRESATITLQSLRGKRYRNADQFISEAKAYILKISTAMRVVDQGFIPPIVDGDIAYEGKYVVYAYTVNHQDIGQLEVVLYKGNNRPTYLFDYVASSAQFDKNVQIAKAMLSTFTGKR